jgi:hypothetical protein
LPAPPKPPSPALEKMSDDQKKSLKEIHDKFATPGRSRLNFVVHNGEPMLTFNISLK